MLYTIHISESVCQVVYKLLAENPKQKLCSREPMFLQSLDLLFVMVISPMEINPPKALKNSPVGVI